MAPESNEISKEVEALLALASFCSQRKVVSVEDARGHAVLASFAGI